MDGNPGGEFIIRRRVSTNGHQVCQMVPVNDKCLLQTRSFGQEGKRDGRTPRTYPIGDERSQVPSHVEPCKFQMRNLDERRCDDLRTFLDGIDDLSWSRNAVTGEILYKKHVQG